MIVLLEGVYHESLHINKSISLIGLGNRENIEIHSPKGFCCTTNTISNCLNLSLQGGVGEESELGIITMRFERKRPLEAWWGIVSCKNSHGGGFAFLSKCTTPEKEVAVVYTIPPELVFPILCLHARMVCQSLEKAMYLDLKSDIFHNKQAGLFINNTATCILQDNDIHHNNNHGVLIHTTNKTSLQRKSYL